MQKVNESGKDPVPYLMMPTVQMCGYIDLITGIKVSVT